MLNDSQARIVTNVAQKIKYKHTFPVDGQMGMMGKSPSNQISFISELPKNLSVIKGMSPKNPSKFQQAQRKKQEKLLQQQRSRGPSENSIKVVKTPR